jgi:hypothetical protein
MAKGYLKRPCKLVPWIHGVFVCVGYVHRWAIKGSGKRMSDGRPVEVEAKGYEPQVSPPSKIRGRHVALDMCRHFI